MSDVRIAVENLGKEFVRRTARGPRTWRNLLASGWQRERTERFWALRDLDFEVRAGEMLGVVGANGAGKSTLLRLLGGVGRPTRGRIRVPGRIGALLDLGGGFLGDLTGRENALLSGVVAGLMRDEVNERMPDIVGFAEMEKSIDSPLHTYSSGMMMRLAFSVAVHTDPAVLLVDEFLSVGDLAFQAKCLARIRELLEGGCAVVLVSHSMDQIQRMCGRALWLRAGQVVAFDSAEVVAGAYEAEMRAETIRRTPSAPPRELADGRQLRINENRFGSLEVEITGVTLRPAGAMFEGGPIEVEITFHTDRTVAAPIFAVTIRRQEGTICVDVNTLVDGAPTPEISGTGTIGLTIDRLDLGAGEYFVDVGIYERTWSYAFDYHWHTYPLVIRGRSANKGIVSPPRRWQFSQSV